MTNSMTRVALCFAFIFSFGAVDAQADDSAAGRQADEILRATGVHGGLIVQLGCGDGRLTAALHADEGYVVHGLDSDPAKIDRARNYIDSKGLYGPVSVEHWTGPDLPYADNTVNLLVAESATGVSMDEVQRVLTPLGVAYMRQGEAWAKTVKPPREGVDEWTHFQYDSTGNPVSRDSVVAPPRHLQWTAEPGFSRSHEYTPSIQAVVSSGNRIFYIADEGPIATLRQPADWNLVARDAYNGIQLWQRPIPRWFPHVYSWTQGPLQLQRKLVAIDDRVYATLGFHAPLSVLDAATGETLTVYADTEGTEEIVYQDGILLLVIREVTEARLAAYDKWRELERLPDSPLHLREPRTPLSNVFRNVENAAGRRLVALQADTGKVLWQLDGKDANGLRSLSLRACGDRVYCEKQEGVCCLDLPSGQMIWTSSSRSLKSVSERAVVTANGEKVSVLSPEDGVQRWSRPLPLASLRDALLIGDSLWLGGGKPYDTGSSKHTGPNWGPYFAIQFDLQTGDLLQEITAENPGHHHRCYDNKATQRYILGGRRGTEFLDLETGDYLWNSWARGTCRYGVMPCNGMLYVPPHACGCYITAKLTGFNAMRPANAADKEAQEPSDESRLVRGPAYGDHVPAVQNAKASSDWPTYRGDAARSAFTTTPVPAKLSIKWQTQLDGPLTAPSVADGKVFVARPTEHQVLAISKASGDIAWTYTANGRVDSPPTIHEGQVVFGGRDGHVYNLRATDGQLAWRFRAARDASRIIDRGQLESVWPVHGSVLVQHESLAFTAGRSSYLDGGLDLYRLNPQTGEILSKTVIYSPDPKTGRQPEQYGPNGMPGARSDILAADEQYLYLRDMTFNLDGAEVSDRKPHLFTLTDFLDDSWTHRSYWIFGTKSSISTGCSGRDRNLLYGRLLAFDDTTVFGYGRQNVNWSSEFEDGDYRVFARRKNADAPHWSQQVPFHARALVVAGDVVFAAGAGPAPGKPAQRQVVADTPLVMALSAVDGAELGRCPIPAPPVLNGMAAADGELILTLEGGAVVSLHAKPR